MLGRWQISGANLETVFNSTELLKCTEIDPGGLRQLFCNMRGRIDVSGQRLEYAWAAASGVPKRLVWEGGRAVRQPDPQRVIIACKRLG